VVKDGAALVTNAVFEVTDCDSEVKDCHLWSQMACRRIQMGILWVQFEVLWVLIGVSRYDPGHLRPWISVLWLQNSFP